MTTGPEPDCIVWRTSGYSANGGNCVEVAPGPNRVLVRDSRDPGGPVPSVTTEEWRAFLATATST